MRLTLFIVNLLAASLLVTVFSICGIFLYSRIFNEPVYVDNQFKPYLKQFRNDAKRYGTSLRMHNLITIFSNNIPLGIAAYCLPSSNVVVVSTRSWEDLNLDGKKALLYHEWGHCILRREHVEEELGYPDYCPLSVMYPYIEPMRHCYKKYMESYNRELFTNPFNFKKFSRSKQK